MKIVRTCFFLLLSVLAGGSANAFSVTESHTSVAKNMAEKQMSFALSADSSPSNAIGDPKESNKSLATMLGSMFLTASVVMGTTFSSPLFIPPAHAETSKIVGELKGSGLVFKDTLQIERFEDPKVKGVTLYISNFQRPITEKLGGNFFNDPSSSSVACAKTGKIAIADNIGRGTSGEEVFKESKSLLFKDLKVQRIYDEEKKSVVYVSFSTRLDKNEDNNKSRFKTSLCAISLDEPGNVANAAP